MFCTTLPYLFRFKFYCSTLVIVLTLTAFTFNTCIGLNSISDIDFKHANFEDFDFEGMDESNFSSSDLNKIDEIDDALANLEVINSDALYKIDLFPG